MELQQYGPAIERLDRIVEMNPQNTAAQLNLYWAHRKAGHKGQAAERLQAMLRLFPADPAVQQLAASAN
jgi:predicted Zn-dependent protease